MPIRYILFIILIFISQLTNGQLINLSFSHISTDDGLSQSEVTCFCQDNKGYIWIGTQDGLNRFDGYQFKIFKYSASNDSSISNNHIRDIISDKKGNLWVATRGGGLNLYNYETESFKSFLSSNSIKGSLKIEQIESLCESRSGSLLFGGGKGLSIVSNKGQINTFLLSYKNYSDFQINSIVESDTNIFWLGTWQGVFQIKIENEIPVTINEFTVSQNDIKKRIRTDGINKIFIDKDSIIWAGTDKGLIKFTNNNGDYSLTNYGLKEGLPSEFVSDIFEDQNKIFWLVTLDAGLCLFDRSNNKFTTYKPNRNYEKSISSNAVSCIFEDKTGVLWIGTIGKGINKIDLAHFKFTHYKIDITDSRELSGNFIRAIHKDNYGIIWLGTLSGGIYKYDRINNTYSNFNFENVQRKIVRSGYHVFDFEEGPNNKLWIATNHGLVLYDRKTEKMSYNRQDWFNPDSLRSNSIFSLEYDDNGNLWVGTWDGLHKLVYENKKSHFVRYIHQDSIPESPSSDPVNHIYNDPLNSDMWIGTKFGGLNRMVADSATGNIKFISYLLDKDDPKSLSNNKVNMVLRSKKGEFWVATNDGLNKMVIEKDKNKPSFIRYYEKDGLPNNHVQSIAEDGSGNLWLGTNNKLSKFDPDTKVFLNYSVEDGLQGNEFSEHTCFKSNDGEMFFGGTNGFNSFYPDSIKKNMFKPRVVITNLLILNKPVKIGDEINGRVILKSAIDETKEITISYRENIFMLEFAALNYSSPNKNKYAYKLEGFNTDWQYTDAQNRKATYTNLKGGKYIFRVIGSNSDGVWNDEGTSLKIIILPPWWETTWFLISLILLIGGLAFGFFSLRINTLRKQKRILEKKVYERTSELQETNALLEKRQEEIEAQDEELKAQKEGIESINNNLNETNIRLEERQKYIEEQAETLNKQNEELNKLNATKDKFFSIIAHDLKNPFNSILGFLELVITRFDSMEEKEKKSLLSFAYQSAQNIFKLLEDLLQWSRSQTGSIKFTPEKFLLNEIVEGNFNLVSELAKKKGITLEKNIQDGVYMHADKNMINTVVRNLLNNSIKFTEKGEVKLLTQKTKDAIIIEISDTGVGMLPEKIDSLFSIEKNKSTSGTGGETGTGLGLIICKDFIDKHNGNITVESELGKGTTFTIKIPLNISVEGLY